MNKRFTKLIAALALLVGLTIPLGMLGQSTVTFDATTDITENASSYQSTELTINAADGSVWTANGYGATANTNIIIGKGGANYLRTPSVEGTITSVTVTWSGNTNYFLALQTTTGTELDAKSNHAESTTETFTVSGNYAQLQLVGRRNSGTSNAAATITQVVVTYTPGSAPQPTTYTVTFDAGEGTFVGNTSFPNASNTIEAGTYELPSATRDGYTFNGWVAGENEPVTGEYTVSGDVDFTAAYTENTTPSGEWNWVLTNLVDLTSSDVFVIVGNNGSNYAMTNNNGTSSAPAASAVTVENDMITSSVANTIQWTISGNATDGYTFYPNGDNEKWLYCTNANNGVRVGTNESKTFEIKDSYLYHKGTNRYVGLYTANGATAPQDWRCYTSINSNITGQSFAFYKKVDANMPVVSADNLELAYNATTGTINYEITNMVEGGVLSVTNTADWITDVVYTTSASGTISFDVAENPNATSRSTDMLLQYVYGDNQMVNATVTVTQTGNPNITMTIAEVRTQGTGNVYTSGIVTSCVGTTGYIQDETAAICVYGSSLTVGDNITVQGSLTTYNGLLEIANPVVNVISIGNTINPELMTIAQINASTNQGWYVRIEEAIVQAIGNNNNYTIAQGENTITLHGELDVEVSVNDIISLNGNIGCYNTVQIVNPQNVEVQESTEPSITVSPNEITVNAEYHQDVLTVTYENLDPTSSNPVAIFYDAEGHETNCSWLWVELQSDRNFRYTIFANEGEARTAYFKIRCNGVYSEMVTVSQAAYVAPVTGDKYVKVASADDLTDGQYLIVYEEGSVAFNGGLETLDATSNTIEVTISNNEIAVAETTAAAEFTIDVTNGTLKSASGKYIGVSTNSNGLKQTDDASTYTNSFSIDESGNAVIAAVFEGSSMTLRYNSASNQNRFRYYTSGQKAIQLYKKAETTPTGPTITVNGYGDTDGGYVLIASPTVEYANPMTIGMATGNYDLYYFDAEQELEWRNYKAQDGGNYNLEPGKGYLYANQETVTITFTGDMNPSFSDVELPYTENDVIKSLYLAGNSSTQAQTFYVNDGNFDHQTFNYLTINEDGNGFISAQATSYTAPAMTGFFVQAPGEGMALSTYDINAKANVSLLNINVLRDRGSIIDNAIVSFSNGSMMDKFYLKNNTTRVYIPQGNREMAIANSAAEAEMPVSFRAAENGTYTLAVEAENVEMDYLHLIDNMTGMDVDLLATPNYTFEARKNDYTSRFRLVFSANGIDEQNAETFAYFNGSEWMVSNLGESTLQVVDVMGRVLSTETISGNAELSLNQPAGVYMLRLINGNDVKVQKVIVK